MLLSVLAVAVFILIAGFGVLLFMFFNQHKEIKNGRNLIDFLHKSRNAVTKDYVELLTKYERVQHGYDQGVLEGKRHAFTSVRAYLTDAIEFEDIRTRAFLVTWLHPKLDGLGKEEHKLLMEMKGLAESGKEFSQANADKLGIEKLEENN
jgi:hypothetical protein